MTRYAFDLHSRIEEANELWSAIKAQGLSVAEVARRCGKNPSWVSRVLVGQNMTLRSLARLSHALGVRVTITTAALAALTPCARRRHHGVASDQVARWRRTQNAENR